MPSHEDMTDQEIRRRMASRKGHITMIKNKAQKDLDYTEEQHLQAAAIEKNMSDLARHRSSYLELEEELVDKSGQDQKNLEEFQEADTETTALLAELKKHQEMGALCRKMTRTLDVIDMASETEAYTTYKAHIGSWKKAYDALEEYLADSGGHRREQFFNQADLLNSRVRPLMAKHEAARPADPVVTTPGLTTSTPSPASRASVKTKTLPVPTFDGTMDLYRPWVDNMKTYFSRMPDVTDSEKAIFLQDAILDKEGLEIVQESQRSKVGYDALMKRLDHAYDKPSEVMLQAVNSLYQIRTPERSGKGVRNFQRVLRRHIDTLIMYGDGTIEQLYTIIATINMDSWMKQKWSEHIVKCPRTPGFPELEDFLLQLSTHCEYEEVAATPTRPPYRASQPPKSTPSNLPSRSQAPAQSDIKEEERRCPACSGTCPKLYRCNSFKSLTVPQRADLVKENRICFNCLSVGHNARFCTSQSKCSTCNGRHNSLLHDDSKSKATCSVTAPQPRERYSIRRTSRVRVTGQGTSVNLMALHDGGSEVTLIERRAAKQLRLKTWPVHLDLRMVTTPAVCTEAIQLRLSSHRTRGDKEIEVLAYIVDDLGQTCPNYDISQAPGMTDFEILPLANPNFCIPEHVDILLGVDTEAEVCLGHTFTSPNSTLVARSTIFGYTIGGVVPETKTITVTPGNVGAIAIEDPLLDLNRFWQDEEPPTISKDTLTVGEEQALSQFDKTVSKDSSNRFQVALPKKDQLLKLGASRPQAYTRLLQCQRTLTRKGTWEKYLDALNDYEKKDHSERVPRDQLQNRAYYLPTHGVVKDSTTTKLRIVFDASAKTTTGNSLNDLLWPGPIVYPQLCNLLMKFRRYPIALSADISQMFREIQLAPEDRDLHRYLVMDHAGRVVDMRMKRLTFGVTSSPFLATQVLRRNARDNEDTYPEAAAVVMNEFYVDDCLTGADTVKEAVQLSRQLCDLMTAGSMTLRKWRSSSTEVLQQIPKELRETERTLPVGSTDHNHLKALGVHWDVSADTLHVATPTVHSTDKATKRQITSDVSRTFDVLGVYAPFTLTLKLLIKELWLIGQDWDDPLPTHMMPTWQDWREGLHIVNQHPIPRRYSTKDSSAATVTIHGFCDASLKAYAAVLYLRVEQEDGTATASLMLCKSKVAPTQDESVPRLELRAAVLLATLLKNTCEALGIPLQRTRAWSDSSSVLHWVRSAPHKHNVFVANRVDKVQTLLPAVPWLYVPTACNPADVASRGCTAADLVHNRLWWDGPPWLRLTASLWPDQTRLSLPPAAELELQKRAVKICAIQFEQPLDLLKRYSDYRKLLKVVAMILRFTSNLKASKAKMPLIKTNHILPKELHQAEVLLWRTHQLHRWPKEIQDLKNGKPVASSSHLLNLKPILKNGLMRVGGRLDNSQVAYSRKHPVILAGKSILARLLISHVHTSNLHAGPSTMIALLSLRAFVIGSKSIIRHISRKCVACQKVYANTSPQMMADLPACRTTPSPPFLHTGIDYAGPIQIKLGPLRRPQKVNAYIALFVCMATKAVHLEVIWDTTAKSFLSLLRRFIARRGLPQHIWSDNGGNFTGCHRLLDELNMKLSACTQELASFCAERQIEWHFSPANGPHFGGLWEAGVKAAKRVLHKIIGHHTLRMEDMVTLLAEVEAILNSRPLCQPSSQPEDGVMALTPGHFLIGRPLVALPEYYIQETPTACRDRFRLTALLAQQFWQRWSSEYLSILQQRHKWLHPRPNLKIGDVVLLTKEDCYLKHWPLGLVTDTHPGADGLVRTVTLRTASSRSITRPTHRLVRLVYEDNFDDWDALLPHPEVDQTSPSYGGEDVQGPDL